MALVARRTFQYAGTRVEAGETLEPQPEGRLRSKLLGHHCYETADTLPVTRITDTPAPGKTTGNSFECPECGQPQKSYHGLSIHMGRAHKE